MSHPSEMEFDLALVDNPGAPFTEHLAACERCRVRLERLRAEQSAFRDGDEPRRAARILHSRLQPGRRWLAFPALAAAAAVALLLLMPRPAIREKGGPAIALFVKRGDAVPFRWEGAPLEEGDAVQLEVQPAGFPQVTVFSVDARCAVTLEHQQALEGASLIPASWTLRGAAGGERLYVVFSHHSVTATDFGAALRGAGGCDPVAAPDFDNAELVARGAVLRAVRP
jgi:hypothetical protein